MRVILALAGLMLIALLAMALIDFHSFVQW